jgi:hypothetical protein
VPAHRHGGRRTTASSRSAGAVWSAPSFHDRINPTESDVYSNVRLCETGGLLMAFQKAKRAAAAAGVMVAAAALPILVASPASATQSACSNYVATHGYFAGAKVKAACSHAPWQAGVVTPSVICLEELLRLHVDASVANAACRRA